MAPWHAGNAQTAGIPREKTLILVWWSGPRGRRWEDFELWNPYSTKSNPQNGSNIIYEPLAYYSASANKNYMWLAESYQFTPDFQQLTIRTRPEISWSDGVSFSAEDVAYTLNTIRDYGPRMKWGVDIAEAMKEARTTDANLCVLGLRFSEDSIAGRERFAMLRARLGDAFEVIELDSSPGNIGGFTKNAHSVLTAEVDGDLWDRHVGETRVEVAPGALLPAASGTAEPAVR